MCALARVGESADLIIIFTQKRVWTVVILSRMTGINKSTISQIENGRLNTTIDKVERIADALGCDVVLVPR